MMRTPISNRALHHSFAAHSPEDGYDIRTTQAWRGDKDVDITMFLHPFQ